MSSSFIRTSGGRPPMPFPTLPRPPRSGVREYIRFARLAVSTACDLCSASSFRDRRKRPKIIGLDLLAFPCTLEQNSAELEKQTNRAFRPACLCRLRYAKCFWCSCNVVLLYGRKCDRIQRRQAHGPSVAGSVVSKEAIAGGENVPVCSSRPRWLSIRCELYVPPNTA